MPRRNPKQVPHQRYFYGGRTCDDKRRYKSEDEAEKAKEHQELLNMGLVLRVYKCPIPGCGGWHLTRGVNNSTT